MKKIGILITGLAVLAMLNSCSKRTVPSKSGSASVEYNYDKSAVETEKPATAEKVVFERKPKTEVAKVITVNDAAASKSVDGRMYYDVGGKRYWKNYKDGKYYLFSKKMYNNPDFKPPVD